MQQTFTLPDPPMIGAREFPDWSEAQELVPIVCTSIGARVKAGTPPVMAIAGELCARFPNPQQLTAVDRHLLAMLEQLVVDHLRAAATSKSRTRAKPAAAPV